MFDWFPKNISTFGGDIDSVFWLIFYIVVVGFILGEAVIIYFAICYRGKEGQRAAFITGEKMSELAWVLVPAAIALVLDFGIDFAGGEAWSKVKGETPESDVNVIVTGKQFNWKISLLKSWRPRATARSITPDPETARRRTSSFPSTVHFSGW